MEKEYAAGGEVSPLSEVYYNSDDFKAAQDEEFKMAEEEIKTSIRARAYTDKFMVTGPHELRVRRAWVWAFESPERLAALAEEYVTHLETAVTDEVCLCLWRIHPEDVELTEKRRKTLIVENADCPVHTKAGRLVGFIQWLSSPKETDGERLG